MNIPTRAAQKKSYAFYSRFPALACASLVAALVFAGAQPSFAGSDYVQNVEFSEHLGLPVYEWAVSDSKPKAIIVAIHGMTLHARRFDSFARHMADAGYPVFATDLRGFGSRQDLPKHEEGKTAVHYRFSQDDMVGLLSELKKKNPQVPIFCVGESLGANMAISLAADHPGLVSGVIASSPCIKRYTHLSPRMVSDVTKSLIKPYRYVSLEPYVANNLSEDPRVVAHYKDDPLIRHELTVAELLKSLGSNKRTMEAMRRLPEDMPVLIVAGSDDKIYKAKALKKFIDDSGYRGAELHVVQNKGHLLLEHAFIDPAVMQLIDSWIFQAVARTTSKNASTDMPASSSSNQSLIPGPG